MTKTESINSAFSMVLMKPFNVIHEFSYCAFSPSVALLSRRHTTSDRHDDEEQKNDEREEGGWQRLKENLAEDETGGLLR